MRKFFLCFLMLSVLAVPSNLFAEEEELENIEVAEDPEPVSWKTEKEGLENQLIEYQKNLKKQEMLNDQLKKAILEMEASMRKRSESVSRESKQDEIRRLENIRKEIIRRTEELEKSRKSLKSKKSLKDKPSVETVESPSPELAQWEDRREALRFAEEELKEKQAAVREVYQAMTKERELLDREKQAFAEEKALFEAAKQSAEPAE